MKPESNSASARITSMTADTCVELFEQYGVNLTPAPAGWVRRNPDPALFGIIGFVGNGVRATCLLGAEQQLIDASCRVGGRRRDWVAELANQLIGGVKVRLLGCGVTVTMTTPLALSGVEFTPLPRFGQEPLEFRSDDGSVLIWLELETDDTLTLDARPLAAVSDDVFF
jgi:hypothetical protein